MNIIESNITFKENTHQYFRKDLEYISVTTVVGKYKKSFNRRFWAMYSGLKEVLGQRVYAREQFDLIDVNGTTHSLDELYSIDYYRDAAKNTKAGWDDITKTACSRGNNIHNYLEGSINISKDDNKGNTNQYINPLKGEIFIFHTKHDLDKTTLNFTYPEIYNTLLYYINQGCTIYAEKKVFIDNYLIAGMIDCLIVKDNYFIILDWKTNKDIIHFTSGYYKKVKVGKKYIKTKEWVSKDDRLLYPLNHLQDCKGSIYTLQLSLYAYIMESWGYKLLSNGLMIYHIRPEERPKLIKVKYLKEDIHNMLEHYKQEA